MFVCVWASDVRASFTSKASARPAFFQCQGVGGQTQRRRPAEETEGKEVGGFLPPTRRQYDTAASPTSSHRSLFNTNSQAPSVIALYSPTPSLPPRSLKRENPLRDWATSTGKKSLFFCFFLFSIKSGLLCPDAEFPFFIF